MSQKKRTPYRKKKQKEQHTHLLLQPSMWTTILLIGVVAIIPLIVRLQVVPLEGIQLDTWIGEDFDADFFSYWKMVVFLVIVVLITMLLLLQRIWQKQRFSRNPFYLPIIVYTGFVILSSVFAEHKDVVFFGFANRYEGGLVLVGYMLVLFAAIYTIRTDRDVRWLFSGFFASAAVIGIIGLFQLIGHDLFASPVGSSMILPGDYRYLVGQLHFQLGENVIYSTLFHYNYVGSYAAMVLPLSISILLLTKKTSWRISAALITVLITVVLIGSQSRAGLVGLALSMIVMAILLRKGILHRWRLSGILVAGLIAGFLVMNAAGGGVYVQRAFSIVTDFFRPPERNQLQSIRTANGLLELKMGPDTLHILNLGRQLILTDTDNLVMATLRIDPAVRDFKIPDERYTEYTLSIEQEEENTLLNLMIRNIRATFLMEGTGFYFVNPAGQITSLQEVDSWGFEGRERIGSARGYIWSRTIPLLKDTILVGHGPDTFAIYFPQHDYVGKMIAYGTSNMIVDKAHNIYLQTALQTGVISLLAQIALFVMYAIQSFRVFWKSSFQRFQEIAGLGIFLAVIGYLGAGIFNDSAIVVAPIFWILLGAGIAINTTLIKKSPRPEGEAI